MNILSILLQIEAPTPEQVEQQRDSIIHGAQQMIEYAKNDPEGFWQTVLKQCRDFAEQYVKDSGDAVVIHLPKHNIHGNSHFMFQEMNNKEIAELVEEWITEHDLK